MVCMNSNSFLKRFLSKTVLFFATFFVATYSYTQITLAFQGGESTDTWGYSVSGASGFALAEANLTPNKITGAKSLVAGGDTGGGNCFGSGSGNGPSVERSFTFANVDLSETNQFPATLTFNWGNRFPSCDGTGWDGGEDLIFVPYFNYIAQAPIMIMAGNNNAQFSIHNHTFTYTVPPCTPNFHFKVYVTTNRADELLFLDDVKLTAPQFNIPLAQPGPISGPTTICAGATAPVTYSFPNVSGLTYEWFGLPTGAIFATPNGSNQIDVNWGGVEPGTYLLSVGVLDACGNPSTPQTIEVDIVIGGTPPTISGPTSMCSGQMVTLTSSQSNDILWSTGATTQSININNPGTYSIDYLSACGFIQTISYTVGQGPGPETTVTTISTCNGASNGAIEVNSTETELQYSLNGGVFQISNVFTGLAAGTYSITVNSSEGCSSEVSATITETPPLVVDATISESSCIGDLIQLNVEVNLPGTAHFYWTGPNGYSTDTQNPGDIVLSGVYHVDVMVGYCIGEDEVTVVLHEVPVVHLSSNAVCEGQMTEFSSVGSGVSAPDFINQWSWNFGDGNTSTNENPNHEYNNSGSYITTLTVTTNMGCSASLQQDVFVAPSPLADFQYSPLEIQVSDPTVDFINTSVGGTTYLWNFGIDGEISTLFSPTYLYPEEPNGYEVELLVTNEFGCKDSVTRAINIGSGITFYVPNSFTPNGDENNAVFIPVLTDGLDLNEYEMIIYNRWGEVMFKTTDVNIGWDGSCKGEVVPSGVYVWDLRIKHLYGPGVEKVQGHVTLIR